MNRITTDRLIMEPISEKHTEYIHKLHTDKLVAKNLFKGVAPTRGQSEERIRQYAETWRDDGFGYFAVYVRKAGTAGGKFIGRSGFRYFRGTKDIEFGHCYYGSETGRGFGLEAGHAVIRFAFEETGMRKIGAAVDSWNVPSLKITPRLGFHYVDDRWLYGRLMCYFAITAEDYGCSYAQSDVA